MQNTKERPGYTVSDCAQQRILERNDSGYIIQTCRYFHQEETNRLRGNTFRLGRRRHTVKLIIYLVRRPNVRIGFSC